ncbi:hypothetical protein [Streptomyces olivochromogenes]|uniref:Uncharacterized protein n=1 Tax=Streptomyces olivochromogenes TaxID=1963 RepID=A0A250VGK7_STROL|nr:hypothetical protein [Streptomyces olivochromogenes]KUN45109.1 hypothetical protein AQJ27_23865 [Streptomyces olivochromogenes]GAX53301.1 hypothetical protein SO3561_04829 [Streptomyces olivochromogenes]
MGGRIAVEPAAPGSDRISSVTRVKAVGIDVPSGPVADTFGGPVAATFGRPIADTFGRPVADTFGPTPVELSRLSFHDSSKFRFGPGKVNQAVDAEVHEGSRLMTSDRR